MASRIRAARPPAVLRRMDTRTAMVSASALGALPLLIIGYFSPTFLRPGALPFIVLIAAFTALTVAIAVRTGRLSEMQFAVLGLGGMTGVALCAHLIADPSGTRAVISMLVIVPAIAASGSPPRVTVSLTAVSIAFATVLTLLGVTSGAVTFVAVGAAATIVLVPVVLIATLRQSLSSATMRLQALADTDPLTGLLNRRGMLSRVEKLLDAAARTEEPVSVLMIDIDHFKTVNDQLGHAAGDEVLVTVATAVLEAVNGSVAAGEAVVSRIGGEEFVVLCLYRATTSLQAAVLERVRSSCQVTVSIGTVKTVIRGSSHQQRDVESVVDNLIRAADRALYTAKDEGRNRGVHADADSLAWTSAPMPTSTESVGPTPLPDLSTAPIKRRTIRRAG